MTMAEPNGCKICGHHWAHCACSAVNKLAQKPIPSAATSGSIADSPSGEEEFNTVWNSHPWPEEEKDIAKKFFLQ